ncbi:uncharacterized protein GGS25DRAFT_251350 [Hypoxylon fragiforme]|uniref:uncharacterized protein n=1 Tax=Hypoxylon fragiforme TaxID=63214 RepID=UPI0020C70ACE|nr:uncharacterized protein GGS25DRAFT_251350 [Hypoxylon fragiforme]KAI2610186.1 hypothetical protein GGS25DRAFT_251350 [Hypoxylon fragiforme]
MAPQTRSSGKSSKDTTYKSTAPAPQQQLFPARRRAVKTYGRPRTTRKSLRQETLTQMNFVSPSMPEENFLISDDDEEESGAMVASAPEPVKAVQPKKRGRGNRRKTTNDELVVEEKPRDAKRRKTLGDAPNPAPSSSFHTQTLTQLLPKIGRGDDQENQEDWQIADSEDEDNADFILETPKKVEDPIRFKDDEESNHQQQQSNLKSSIPKSGISATPTNRQTRAQLRAVVPSSTSPESLATPMAKRAVEWDDSPLRTKSTTKSSPMTLAKVRQISKGRVIADSFTTSSPSPKKSAANATPSKRLRFELPEEKENITPGRTEPKIPKVLRKTPARPALQPLRSISEEVPDSDLEDLYESEDELEETAVGDQNTSMEPDAEETCYGDIGEETQAELLASTKENVIALSEDDTRESSRSVVSTTPTPMPKRVWGPSTTEASAVKHTAMSSPTKRPSDPDLESTQTQLFSQYPDSQRLSLEAIRALGPQHGSSDILISLAPEPLAQILNRRKNHEFRKWHVNDDLLERVWIYSTSSKEVKYMFKVGPAKRPGEIEDEDGIGNKEFNQNKLPERYFYQIYNPSRSGEIYAYEILQVYELNDPLSPEELKKISGIKASPRTYKHIPPAAIGELTANLKCALFSEEDEDFAEPDIPKLQLGAPTQPASEPRGESSLRATSKAIQPETSYAKPSVPKLQHGSSNQKTPRSVRPSQATTVSSPNISPEKSLPRGMNPLSDIILRNMPPSSSPTAYRTTGNDSLRSSQFPTRSQMLPDSLVNDEIRAPPPIIWDSEDESD